jgi:hypothetical protein
MSRNPAQRQLYEARWKFQRDEAACLKAAFNQGLEEGHALARARAREERLQAGIENEALVGIIPLLQEL